ncbi:MAG: hypothetical protein BRC23_01395 [Parcubacteria group bacterium SW_4_49_11]|nr:MAG: hypothetical protein BRC23_01395 [Parcubacteria group bacterium SW_4_49_11]
MNIRERPLLILAIAVLIQVALLGALLGKQIFTVQSGTTIRLEVAPMDPRSPLRGDYMDLRYSISRIEGEKIQAPDRLEGGDTVFVHLEQESSDDTWKAIKVTPSRPSDQLSIKGVVKSGMRPVSRTTSSGRRVLQNEEFARSISVEYGIEQYFIPEGSGRGSTNLDNIDLDNAEVTVKVDRFGNAVLQQLYMDGEPWP